MPTDAQLAELSRGAWSRGLAGDVAQIDEVLAVLDRPVPLVRAWSVALSSLRWHAVPQGALVRPAELTGFVDADAPVREAAAFAAGEALRAHFIAFDLKGVHACYQALDALCRDQPTERARLRLGLGRALVSVMRGVATPEDELAMLGRTAMELDEPMCVIEATVLRAIGALLRHDLDAATEHGRRGSRMARTEAIPQAEYFANVVLARIRRVTSRPHLATRILGALSRVASAQWRGWIAWEMLMTGSADVEPPALEEHRWGFADRASVAARSLGELFGAARAGDRAEYARLSSGQLRDVAEDFWLAARDLAMADMVLDGDRDPVEAEDDLRAWCEGQIAVAPGEVAGLCVSVDDAAPEHAVAYVVGRPGVIGRRIVAEGAHLMRDTARLPMTKGNPGRVEITLAVLALSGPKGLETPTLFRRVYGFDYEPALHRGVLDTLLHRARARLAEMGALERDGEVVRLSLTESILIPDPRCAQPLEELVLRLLARSGAVSAKDTAKALGVPLRTAHRALHQFLDEGACEKEREGRNVHYRVEDTTFSEPTRA